jgi:hypothetical protein
MGQVLRYLDAIAPGVTLLQLLLESDPSLAVLAQKEQTQRVRGMSAADIDALNF